MINSDEVTLILDDDLDRILARPREFHASIRSMVSVIEYILRLRSRLARQQILVHHTMLDVATEIGIACGARGPQGALADKYGEGAVDEPFVIEFLRTWIERCKKTGGQRG